MCVCMNLFGRGVGALARMSMYDYMCERLSFNINYYMILCIQTHARMQ